MSLLAAAFLAAPVRAEGWQGGARLQSAGGWDSNPGEGTDESDGEAFFRAQAEVGAARSFHPPLLRALEFTLRAFDERYVDLPAEHRAQIEARCRLDQSLGGRGGSGRWELATRTRAYPDSTRRGFARHRLRWDGRFRLGPEGTFRPSFDLERIALRSSDEDDRTQLEFGLGYEWKIAPNWALFGGLDLGGARYERASLQRSRDEDGDLVLVEGPAQATDHRRARLGARYLGPMVLQVEYAYVSQSSNSFGASLGRHEFRWLVSRSLLWRTTAQFFGNLESTHYDDPELDDFYILLPGEELEARDDDNLVAVQASRSVGETVRLHVRHTWFRNETLLVGTYYRKAVWSAGITWQIGTVSGF